MNLNQIDCEILRILQSNGRISNLDLAKQINMSPPPTLERVRKLEKSGVIKKYVALLEPTEVGIDMFSFVEVTLSSHGSDVITSFAEAVNHLDEVMECHHITGDADFLLKIAVKNIQAYEQLIINKLTKLPNIRHLKTSVVLSTLKNDTALKIEEGKK